MPNLIDIKTVFLFTSFIALTGCICLVYVHQTVKTYSGFNRWTLASYLYFFSGILASFRNMTPDIVSIVFGNFIFIAAILLSLRGLYEFVDLPYPEWIDIVCMSVVVFTLYFFTYIHPHLDIRIALISLTVSTITGGSVYILYKHLYQKLSLRNWLLMGFLGLITILFLLRTILALAIGSNDADLTKAGLSQSLFLMVLGIAHVGVYMGQIIMNYQRLGVDYRSAKSDLQMLEGLIPICTNCKKVRDDEGYWNQIEAYISKKSDAKFSHSICPSCAKILYPEMDIENKLE